MKFKTIILGLITLALSAIINDSCSVEKTGRSSEAAFDGIFRSVENNFHFSDPDSRASFISKLDVLLADFSNSGVRVAGALGDTLLSERRIDDIGRLAHLLIGKETGDDVQRLRKVLIGESTDDLIRIIRELRSWVSDFPSASSVEHIGRLREELIGAKSNSEINTILENLLTSLDNHSGNLFNKLLVSIDSNVNHMFSGLLITLGTKGDQTIDTLLGTLQYRGKGISDIITGNVDHVTNMLKWALGIVVSILLIIIAIVYYFLAKYEKSTIIMANKIHHLSNRDAYDELTHNIKNEALSTGNEPFLRWVLKRNGLLDSKAWMKGKGVSNRNE